MKFNLQLGAPVATCIFAVMLGILIGAIFWNRGVKAELTVTRDFIFEDERLTTRGGPMERIADYRVVDLWITENTYKGRTWFATNVVDTGFMIRRREVHGFGTNQWIAVPDK